MKNKILNFILIIALILVFSSMVGKANDIKNYSYEIVNKFPHDENAFTQGFLYKDGYIYEGTGKYGESSLRKIDLKSGKIIKEFELDDNYFGEGITILNDKIYQLSWKSNKAFVYNLDFEKIDSFEYEGEGWGLTDNDKELIMSNGSDKIYFIDPHNFEINRKISVKINDKKINNLNELEYIKGKIYANIWKKDYILIIEPQNGQVKGKIDLKNLIDKENQEDINVLNGIAYDQKNDRLFVTGKLWPYVFEIKLLDN
ncbi:MAG: glutaminyl-peptide cyclotransferase [Candidatus Woesearchaeota archaeon]